MHTTMSNITIELFPEDAPITVENFVELATGEREWTDPLTGEKSHEPFYNGLIFHRVIKDFMIQGGCPLGTGTGGSGYNFDDEINKHSFAEPYKFAMANAGRRPNSFAGKLSGTNGSQSFITTVPTTWLDGKHTIFGEVTDEASRKVVDSINEVTADTRDNPLEPVMIESIDIVR